jgi:di/tripeptidase
MTQKNPFEIRAEMVELAKQYMDNQQAYAATMAELLFKQGEIQVEEMQKAYQMYSLDDLMETAKKMYSFVSTKDTEK